MQNNLEIASVIALAHTVVGQSNMLSEAVRACTDEAIQVVTELRVDLADARAEIARLRTELAQMNAQLSA